jgi:hypothetical protein
MQRRQLALLGALGRATQLVAADLAREEGGVARDAVVFRMRRRCLRLSLVEQLVLLTPVLWRSRSKCDLSSSLSTTTSPSRTAGDLTSPGSPAVQGSTVKLG